MMALNEALQTYADAFTWAERPSGERYCKLKADAPDWEDGTDESDRVHCLADALVAFVTNELLEWLKAPWARELYQEALDDFGRADTFDEEIQRAQFLALERIAFEILRQCREHAEEER